jgi:hypothetical protein
MKFAPRTSADEYVAECERHWRNDELAILRQGLRDQRSPLNREALINLAWHVLPGAVCGVLFVAALLYGFSWLKAIVDLFGGLPQ